MSEFSTAPNMLLKTSEYDLKRSFVFAQYSEQNSMNSIYSGLCYFTLHDTVDIENLKYITNLVKVKVRIYAL